LFDWCLMFMDDEAVPVRLAALRGIRECPEADVSVVEPMAESGDKRVRAAAIAALAVHAGRDAPRWFERGLKDPEACVRRETAGALRGLDPARHRRLFELALCDPNPDVARVARKLTEGKGYGKPKW
jgi:HEAT repeat protein